MNNERKLYELIKANNNLLVMHDVDVAKQLGVSKYSIPNYKKRLIESGLIETKVKIIDNRPITLYRIVKEYNGEIKW